MYKSETKRKMKQCRYWKALVFEGNTEEATGGAL